MNSDRIHFVTGRLAERSLRSIVAKVAKEAGFDYSIQVVGITVAALMKSSWLARRVEIPADTTKVIVPGYCNGDLAEIRDQCGVPVERGPKDLHALPQFFGQKADEKQDYGAYDIEILAEINHAPRLGIDVVLAEAAKLSAAGADVIDVGCDPDGPWQEVGSCVRALCEAGHRVSIDSQHTSEIEAAIAAGAQLVLSVNSSNRDAAKDWGSDIEVVVVPDDPTDLDSLDGTIEMLACAGVPMRIDPILEPIGFGFAGSMGRYVETRRRYPDAEMLMGIGNLTELTDADSGPINVLLLGFCQELGIRSVLTTQVINWARTSVQECDLARRLVYYAVNHRRLPKRLEPNLVTLRDTRLLPAEPGELDQLAAAIRDNNYRIFAEADALHLLSAGTHLESDDPFLLFERLMETTPTNMTPAHAFYLGFELSKAATARQLGKQYRQDESLDWGYLTDAEPLHRISRRTKPESHKK